MWPSVSPSTREMPQIDIAVRGMQIAPMTAARPSPSVNLQQPIETKAPTPPEPNAQSERVWLYSSQPDARSKNASASAARSSSGKRNASGPDWLRWRVIS